MADPITYADFAKLELRVAKVLEARPHPNADRLLLLQVDVGEEQKQIVAGIRQHYAPEQLVGKLIVIVNNLEPAMLRGESSNGMLLAATSNDKVVVLTVDDPTCVVGRRSSDGHHNQNGPRGRRVRVRRPRRFPDAPRARSRGSELPRAHRPQVAPRPRANVRPGSLHRRAPGTGLAAA